MPAKRAAKAKSERETREQAKARLSKLHGRRIGSLADVLADVEALPTGNLSIDSILGVGGFPKGRVGELFGPPQSGKTTMALQMAAALQREGGVVLYLDYENALDPEYCAALGLDTESDLFDLEQPDTMEEGEETLLGMIRTGEIGLAIVDSVAMMTTRKELDAEPGVNLPAEKARLMHSLMRKLTPTARESNTAVLFVNHMRQVIDMTPMGQRLAAQGVNRTTTPGGDALKFQASVRVQFKPIGQVKEKDDDPISGEEVDQAVGSKVQVTVIKNKVGVPYRKAEVRIKYGRGFSQAYSAFSVLVGNGLIKKGSAGNYGFAPGLVPEDVTVPRGEAAILSAIESEPEWLDLLVSQAKAQLEAGVPRVEAPPEPDPDPEPETEGSEEPSLGGEGPESDAVDALLGGG